MNGLKVAWVCTWQARRPALRRPAGQAQTRALLLLAEIAELGLLPSRAGGVKTREGEVVKAMQWTLVGEE